MPAQKEIKEILIECVIGTGLAAGRGSRGLMLNKSIKLPFIHIGEDLDKKH